MADVPFEEAAREFLAYHAVNSNDPETMRSLFRVFARHFTGRLMSTLDVRTLRLFAAERFEDGVSRPTLNRYRSGLRGFFAWAIDQGSYHGTNPADSLKRHKEPRGHPRFFTPGEVDALHLASAPHMKPIVLCGVDTGGRESELLGLRGRDLAFENRIVTFRCETTKNGKVRDVPMTDRLHACLWEIRPRRPDQHVFLYNGAPIVRTKTAFHSAMQRAGVREASIKTLRHTFASWYMQNGGDIYDLKELLGHSTVKMTEVYAHLSPKYLKSKVKFIGPPGRRLTEAEDADR